jgi:ABC-type antimicrobial peptide transport system permease subunit
MLRIYRTLQTALRALVRNPMRAFLTTLGIIIGVAAVIATMEIGNGSSAAIEKAIASLGSNVLMIFPGNVAATGISQGVGSSMSLSPQDCEAILRECSAVRSAAPVVRFGGQIIYGNKNWLPDQILGSTTAFLDVREWEIADGEPFTDQDVRGARKVCILGQTVVNNLFGPGESAVGKEVRLANSSIRVLGVLSPKGANMGGQDQDNFVLLPWTTIKYRISGASASGNVAGSSISTAVNSLNQLYPSASTTLYPQPSAVQAADTPLPVRFTNVNMILAAAQSADDTQLAISQITGLLRERHRTHPENPEDFTIRDLTELVRTRSQTVDIMRVLLIIMASISLAVGGVGIMNIMLVSVTERTREIGLRMAVGARGRDIMQQFLTEAVLLCLVGGVLGIGLGLFLTYLLVTMMMHWPTETSFLAIFGSVFVSAAVGITFGFYPAWKASRLDPIEALRYE